jgi:hypothetical protein
VRSRYSQVHDVAVTPELLETLLKLEAIFMPHATRQRLRIYENRTKDFARFVHYTSAEAALSIIRSKRIWMRNTMCMSDYLEVQHGHQLLHKVLSTNDNAKRLFAALDACVPGAAEESFKLFDQWWNDIRFNTYITSISEHDDSEDSHGRLSMWRAFGGSNSARVGIVLKLPKFSPATDALNIMASPVAYLREADVNADVNQIIQNIEDSCGYLPTVDRPLIVSCVYNMLAAGVVCMKHEGFHEEREWRVVYGPKRNASPLMETATETIGGVPQIIHKIPLDRTVSDDLADIDVAQIFDRLIIGPSMYALPMYEAFVGALTEKGVPDAAKRVVISGIPIRS